jgi:hypothetical protein
VRFQWYHGLGIVFDAHCTVEANSSSQAEVKATELLEQADPSHQWDLVSVLVEVGPSDGIIPIWADSKPGKVYGAQIPPEAD